MSGYDYQNGMSNNAVSAYQVGIKPLSQITLADLRQAGWLNTKKTAIALAKNGFWCPSEWHHSGGTWYNKIDFFNPDDLVELWNELSEKERTKKLQSFAKNQPIQKEERVKGHYAQFGGSRRHPRFLGNVDFTGILIGNWIHLDCGGKKKASGNNIFWELLNAK